ncbi:MAG: DPP IV N-terminal domain-containing protein [Fulvivirga sp.]
MAFIRTPGGKGAALPILEQRHSPWEIWVANVATGDSSQRWKSPETLAGSIPTVDGGFNFHWAADNQLIYLSYEDGWPDLYAMDATSGESRLLTPGEFHVEHVRLSPDRKILLFSANASDEPEDIDRRHIGEVVIVDGELTWRTSGRGIETYPVFVGEEKTIAYLSATAKRPPLAEVQFDGGNTKLLAKDFIPSDFPQEQLIT